MNLLASGPCPLDSGPVGRWSSRGWIRFVKLDARSRGIFELTPLGRAQLEKIWAVREPPRRTKRTTRASDGQIESLGIPAGMRM
jgi:DNA-binding PadR family transcriptional regulator